MSNFKRIQKLLKKTSRFPLASLNYHLGNYQETIWLVGDGRSGSTWLSDLINWDRGYRELFEPFHPRIVRQVQDFSLFQYLRPEETDSELSNFLKSVFTGEFKHFRADVSQPRLFYQGLLVKDIFAHLLVPWVSHNLPHVKKVLIVRNPFAVALSKQKLKNWTWMKEPQAFLTQKSLYDDYLAPHQEVIFQVGDDFIEKQILIWAIVHYVTFQSLTQEDIHLVFYEDLVSNSTIEIQRLFNYLGKAWSNDEILLQKIDKPTRTSRDLQKDSSKINMLDSWKNKLSVEQIDRGMKILEYFQLEGIYQNNSKSNKLALVKEKFAF
ncbi:MAG: sulfotransferase domain-containing protein [Xenococcus sp. (in: cyanobacteria)]